MKLTAALKTQNTPNLSLMSHNLHTKTTEMEYQHS